MKLVLYIVARCSNNSNTSARRVLLRDCCTMARRCSTTRFRSLRQSSSHSGLKPLHERVGSGCASSDGSLDASTPHCWAANPTAPSFLAVFFSALATNWSRSCSSSLRKTRIGPAPHAQNRRGVVITAHVLEARTRLGQRQRTGQRRATLVRQRRIAIVVQTRVTNAIDDDASIVSIGIICDVGSASDDRGGRCRPAIRSG